MNLPPAFNTQFIDDDGTPLSGGFLYTYVSGTTTPQVSYQTSADDAAENANPIELDAAGRCDLWLDPALEYSFLLQRADTSEVRTWDNVSGVASENAIVSSVNGSTGDVVLTADDIGYTTSTSTDWFGTPADVTAGLDALVNKVDTVAAAVSTAASGTYTPTLGPSSNVAASTAHPCQWMRIGDVVTVSGMLEIDPTAAAFTVLDISLPIASNFSSNYQCAGTGAEASGTWPGAWAINADIFQKRAMLNTSNATGLTLSNHEVSFSFTYLVV